MSLSNPFTIWWDYESTCSSLKHKNSDQPGTRCSYRIKSLILIFESHQIPLENCSRRRAKLLDPTRLLWTARNHRQSGAWVFIILFWRRNHLDCTSSSSAFSQSQGTRSFVMITVKNPSRNLFFAEPLITEGSFWSCFWLILWFIGPGR